LLKKGEFILTIILGLKKEADMQENKSYMSSIIIIGVLFFIFGFVTWLNGTLMPFLKISCELSTSQTLWVTFAFYISYFVMALPSSKILEKIGYKKGMSLGLLVMAVGSLVFIPAALEREFLLFLIGLFIQGTGLALLQTAANPYAIIIGPQESAAGRIAIMGIANKIGGILAPLILGFIVLGDIKNIENKLAMSGGNEKQAILNGLSEGVIVPYLFMAIALVGLAFWLNRSALPEIDNESDIIDVEDENNPSRKWWSYKHLLLGFVAIFVYVGAEVIAGDTISLYGQSLKIPLDTAKFFTSLTLGCMLIGYIIGYFTIPKYVSQDKALAISAILGAILSFGIILSDGKTSVAFIALLGLANAMMWPAIFPLALADLGKSMKNGSALLIMGIAGGAIMPKLYGWLSEVSTPQLGYLILVPMYLYILYFALKGHSIRD